MKETNVFRALSQALWARGEDGEVIARDLATALFDVMVEGKGPLTDEEATAEFTRLRAKD